MKVLKFGGKSLAATPNFEQIINIITDESTTDKLSIVVSAIGDTTDELCRLLELSKNGGAYQKVFAAYCNRPYHDKAVVSDELSYLKKLFEGVSLVGDYSAKTKDIILAQGELIASKLLASTLAKQGINAIAVDSRAFFITTEEFGQAQIRQQVSQRKTSTYFTNLTPGAIPIVTGFIGASAQGHTTTLGRNGSNYSAALLANYIDASVLLNYTNIDGIYTANPDWVKTAKRIDALHYDDANELVKFGASILHAKTLLPLTEKNIPLHIYNTLTPADGGSIISALPTTKGIKSLALEKEVALIELNGSGLVGIVGVDSRVFSALARARISVGLISQSSSERGLGFVVAAESAELAKETLEHEFQYDFHTNNVHKITIRQDVAVLSIIGQDLSTFDNAYRALAKHKITPILFNNALSGKNVSLVLKKSEAIKALNVIHGQIFGITKQINLAIFGHGVVGSALIDQILHAAEDISAKKNIHLNIFAIGNSKKMLFNADGISKNWRKELEQSPDSYTIADVINFSQDNHLENLIAVDNTASTAFVDNYIPLVESGYNLVSSNKKANTISYNFYEVLRETLKENRKDYLYETNVGAGLPLIDTIKLLHLSGENITKIKGVFSGSLSHIFNQFSAPDIKFSTVLADAIAQGFTEPDPREDLSGYDVGRKLLILARELDLKNGMEEINIQSLIPQEFQDNSRDYFLKNLERLNPFFDHFKHTLKPGHALRYLGELSGDLSKKKGILETKLVQVPLSSPLGQLGGADNIFEIYTESYGEKPLIIQGAGAGAKVTARGVFGDILRLAKEL